jgi:putative transposase
MARRKRVAPGGCVYHVCNRGSRKGEILKTYEDYSNFVRLINVTREKFRMRILAHNLLGNHFHLVLWPWRDNDLPRFMKSLEQKHAQRFHRRRGTVGCGAVYQARYVSRMITEDRKLITLLRYVESNARRHGLVERAEEWPWCSAWNREPIGPTVVIDDSPVPRPSNWLDFLNE